MDLINDDKSASEATGFGGGTDVIRFLDVNGADLRLFHIGNHLYITDVIDVADGYINAGVVIENFYSGGNNLIEYVIGVDNTGYNMSGWA